ncbi:MAG TPA: BatA domain-containing protein [Planctomycetota bacterium]|jgi:hypothetical protein
MFANPIFLWGVLGAAVPIIVHLIFRRQRTAMNLPTLMFLRRVEMKLASRKRLKEIILLTLRALAIALLALALARPGFQSAKGVGPSGATADCVIVLDNSASMGLKSPMGTRLDAAKAAATSVISTLGAEGRAAVLTYVYSEPGQQIAALTGEKEKLQKALQTITPTAGTGSISGMLARAAELLEQSSSAPNREIYLISDFQGNAFKDESSIKSAAANLPAKVALFLCPVGGGAPESNASIIGVSTDPRPKVAGRRITLMVKVKNNCQHEMTTSVSAALKDQPPQQINATIQSGAVQEVPLPITLGQEGFLSGEIKLDPDDANFDNVWPFCIDVRGPIRVLVVSPGGEKREEMEESFYLRKALDPTGDGRLSGIRVTHFSQQNAPQQTLDGYDAIILCGCFGLPEPTLKLLDGFLQRGGGLMVFGGRRDLGLMDKHPLQKFLLGKISGETSAPKDQNPLGLRALQMASPYFEDSRTLEGRVEFKEVSMLKALKVTPVEGASVIAEYTNGQPAILVQQRGAGRIMYWTASPNAEDSNLPLMPSFLSLLHCSVSVLCNVQSQNIERKAGQPMLLDLSSAITKEALPTVVTVFDPEEKSYEVPMVGGRMAWRDTGRVGIYRMQAKGVAPASAPAGRDAGTTRAVTRAGPSLIPPGFAVVPDADEGDPSYVPAEEVKKMLGMKFSYVIPAGTDVVSVVGQTRQGRELFGWFIAGSLLMVLAEAMLANAIGTSSRQKGPAPAAPVVARVPEGPGLKLRAEKEEVGSGSGQ